MKLNTLPISGSFFENEHSAVRYLATSAYCATQYPGLNAACIKELSRHDALPKPKKKGATNIQSGMITDFGCSFDIPKFNTHSGKKLYIGGLVEVDAKGAYTRYSYHLALKNQANRFERKFHFDFDPGHSGKKQACPFFHIQYGGVASPHIKGDHPYDHQRYAEDLLPGISEPRITFYPFCLPFLISIALLEFDPAGMSSLLHDGAWKNIMMRAEQLLWAPWIDVIRDRFNKNSLILDSAYCD